MDQEFESRLMKTAKSLITSKGRGGDWEHTLRTIEYARVLLKHEEGEPEIVFPALYLHDVGWCGVDFQDFVKADGARKLETESLSLHMKQGAELAWRILRDLGYDPEKIEIIASIIAIHDEPNKVFALGNPSATIVVEADRLDRYGAESLVRYEAMFGDVYLKDKHGKEVASYLREGIKLWFRTHTAKAIAYEMAKKTGLFEENFIAVKGDKEVE